jgi:sugar diacid utilization regulator
VTPGPAQRDGPIGLREQLSSLQGLLALSSLMTESGDERSIIDLAAKTLPSLGGCRLLAVYLLHVGWRAPAAGPESPERERLLSQLERLGSVGGALEVPGQGWSWAFPLRSLEGHFGYLVIGSARAPADPEQFLIRVLAQQVGMALANAALLTRVLARAEELRDANDALAGTVAALERSTSIHARLTEVAASGQGEAGIAQAVHELSGYPIAVEDPHGNLRAWAGPDRPDSYVKDSPESRERLLRRAVREGHPIRDGARLVVVARAGDDILGMLVLLDPTGEAGEREYVALEHGATVLAMELARLRSLGEAELRLRRDLVEELLAGTDSESALARAGALGYDLQRPHRVVVVEGANPGGDGAQLFEAVRRAALDTGVGSLLVERGGAVVVLSDALDAPWKRFRSAVVSELAGGRCRLGVGDACLTPGDFPRSYREARLALMLQRTAGGGDQATLFEDLGVYRILVDIRDAERVDDFVHEWLGTLLDYDAHKGSDLVMTLSRYMECGRNYDLTARALGVHRSTLKYRLQRIREISGYDLGDPDTHFNLHFATRAWETRLALRGEL